MKLSPKQREALNLVADGKFIPRLVKEDDGWHARWRALGVDDDGVNGWVDEYVREFTVTRLSEDAEDQKHETLHDAWMRALRSQTGLVVWDDAECAAFAAELEAWGGNAEDDVAARRTIVFRFESSKVRKFESSGKEGFAVSCEVPKGRRALKALGQAAYVWSPLVGLKLSNSQTFKLSNFPFPGPRPRTSFAMPRGSCGMRAMALRASISPRRLRRARRWMRGEAERIPLLHS